MIGDLANFVGDQRAVYAAEERLDAAEHELVLALTGANRARLAAARTRYRTALADLQVALAKRHKVQSDLSGRRHLILVMSPDRTHQESKAAP